MRKTTHDPAPPHCPNPACRAHLGGPWHWVRDGFYSRPSSPQRIQRYRCRLCRRRFSQQTFRTSYWLRRPDLLEPTFSGLIACSGFRQLARTHHVSPQTIARLAARLGRHCLLVHEALRPRLGLAESLGLDTFVSFEHSQYHPTGFHLLLGRRSHFVYGFTDSELRRSGRMTAHQKRRRSELERTRGRPDPRSTEREVATVLALVAPTPQSLDLWTDEHRDYPRALRRLPHLDVCHHTVSSRAPRTTSNPLFALNLFDLLIRHSSANHKRETIAFSKRRQAAIDRLWLTVVWRNYLKWTSERRRRDTPAMRLGILERRLSIPELLATRRFVTRSTLPARWRIHYDHRTPTRAYPRIATHRCRYAR